MALPVSYQIVTVEGTFIDSKGRPHTGTVTAVPPIRRREPNAKLVITPVPEQAALDPASGKFSLPLPASNDPDLYPQGGQYAIQVRLTAPTPYSYDFLLTVPFDTPGGVLDISSLGETDPAAPITNTVSPASIGAERAVDREGALPGYVVALASNGRDLVLVAGGGGSGGASGDLFVPLAQGDLKPVPYSPWPTGIPSGGHTWKGQTLRAAGAAPAGAAITVEWRLANGTVITGSQITLPAGSSEVTVASAFTVASGALMFPWVTSRGSTAPGSGVSTLLLYADPA